MSLVVIVTSPTELAHEMARVLVGERLAGCVNVIPNISSVYRWQGEVLEDSECLLLIKTTGERYKELESRILSLHSYEVPEIIAIPFDRALPEFQFWLRDSVKTGY